MLVLYTDGLIERRGESLDVGLDRLAEVLRTAPDAVEDVADRLLRDFLADDAPADDVALLCVGVRGPEASLRLRVPAARAPALAHAARGDGMAARGSVRRSWRPTRSRLAVNEAAANAIEHAYGLSDEEFVVEADQHGDRVELVVRDFGQWRTRRTSGDRGRGLDLAARADGLGERGTRFGRDRRAARAPPRRPGGRDPVKPLAQVTLDPRGPVLVAHLAGEVDLSNVEDIRVALVDAVSHDMEYLILDLTATEYLDSTGVRLLFELAERLQGRRQELRLVVDDETLVQRVIMLTQLDQRVPLDVTVDQAIAAVGGR